MDEAAKLLCLAEENLGSARDNAARQPPRRAVAFTEARHAMELGCKVLLLRSVGHYPRKHDVAGALAQAKAIPAGINPRRLDRLLRQATRGEYGEGPEPTDGEVAEVIQVADEILAACR